MACQRAVRRCLQPFRAYVRGVSSAPQPPGNESVIGTHTPATKHLWLNLGRRSWSKDELEKMRPLSNPDPKPPTVTSITCQFSSDSYLRELYRSPWNEVRLGRLLEDLDAMAGYIAFTHSMPQEAGVRPPLCVTAAVEAIELRTHALTLEEDLTLRGWVVWTGRSSLDVCIQALQGGAKQVVALFTFVARDPLTNEALPISPVQPVTDTDRQLFEARQAIADARREDRAKASRTATGLHNQGLPVEAARWAARLLQEGRSLATAPALVDPGALLTSSTELKNVFICMPQQRNMYGRVFGGFLMRRAFELALSTAYMVSGTRPKLVDVDEILFRKPVDVADLIEFRAVVLHTWQSGRDPTKGMARVQVEASVTRPEAGVTTQTNTFNFQFVFDLRRDGQGNLILPRRILPASEGEAVEIARWFGPGASQSRFHKML